MARQVVPKRPILFASGALLVLLLLGLAGGYIYYFSGIRTSARPLSLGSPSPAASAFPSPGAASPLAGNWTVGSGSVAGYLVNEQFAGQTSGHQAEARTSSVTGGLAVDGANASAINIVVDLTSLHSVDQVLGLNVSNRDRIVSQTLSVQQFPQATFKADSMTLPAGLDSGQQTTVSVPGRLTIRGVTRPVTASIKAQLSGSTVQVLGTINTNMTDFGVTPPALSITVVQPQVTIEFQLNLTRSA